MSKNEIFTKLNSIFRNIFDDKTIMVSESTSHDPHVFLFFLFSSRLVYSVITFCHKRYAGPACWGSSYCFSSFPALRSQGSSCSAVSLSHIPAVCRSTGSKQRSGESRYFVRTGIQPQKRDSTVPKIQETTELSSSAETALKSLIRKADENGFDLLFVMPPYCETAQDRMLFNRAAEIISASGYTAIDFNELYDEIGIDELNDYYDPGHTNVIGAGKYTGYLAGYLSSRYGLENHLSGQDRSNWDQGLELWKAEEKEAIRNCLSKRKTIFDF